MKHQQSGESIALTIEKYAPPGIGLGYARDKAVFVPATSPGDQVQARVTQEKKRHMRAEVTAILEPSPQRVETFCPHYLQCGGCDLMHITYPDQVSLKQRMAQETLAGQSMIREIPLVPSPEPVAYRHRAQLKVCQGQVGFFARGTNQIVSIANCPVLAPPLQQVVQDMAARPPRDGDYLLLASARQASAAVSFRDHRACEPVEGFPPMVQEDYGFGPMLLDSAGFAQANPFVTVLMASHVASACAGQHVFEGYCGSGTFSRAIASGAASLEAWEISAPAVKLARRNCRDLANTRFQAGDAEKSAIGSDRQIVVVDPPRTGLGRGMTSRILASHAKKLIYISCNPATMARDLRFLQENSAFTLTHLEGFDMYPHTTHLEMLAMLER